MGQIVYTVLPCRCGDRGREWSTFPPSGGEFWIKCRDQACEARTAIYDGPWKAAASWNAMQDWERGKWG